MISTKASEILLVVDDDEYVREISVRLLREQGYGVVETGDGKQAIEHLKGDQTFDLLFIDIVLPGGMNGVEIAEEAKRLQPGIKILLTSGYAMDILMHKGILDPGVTRLCYPVNALMHNGMPKPGVSFLRKPYLPLKLLDKVREVLDSGDD